MTPYASLNPYWRQYFAQHEAQGHSLEEVLGDIDQLNLKEPGEIDLTLCLQMPKLRFIRIWAPGPVVGIENIPLIPQLRELIIGSDSFTQEHLPFIAASPLLNNLVIIQIPFDDLDALNDSPRIKSLSLVGVTTLAPEAIARLTKITSLRISKLGAVDLAPLASMPKLRSLELDRLQLENLKVLGAKKLVDFDYGDKAADESDLALVGERTQLVAFNYPVSDVAPPGRPHEAREHHARWLSRTRPRSDQSPPNWWCSRALCAVKRSSASTDRAGKAGVAFHAFNRIPGRLGTIRSTENRLTYLPNAPKGRRDE